MVSIRIGLLLRIKAKIRACVSITKTVTIAIVCMPAIFFIRLIRPIKLIRFGYIKDFTIGHFSHDVELYLCERDHGFLPPKSFDIFCRGPKKSIVNQQLLAMWKRILHISRVTFYLYMANDYIPGGESHRFEIHSRDVYGLLEKSKVHLSFVDDEIKEAESSKQAMGIEGDNTYVCVVNRDSTYKEKICPSRDWSYHDYRNDNIQNYVLACEELTKRGHFVIRMGNVVKEVMDTSDSKIIEYAHRGYRTELLDLYLPANCCFFISGDVGLGAMPRTFRKPIVMCNLAPIEHFLTWGSNIISIPKRFWLKKEKKFMTFLEIFNSGAGRYLYTQKYETHGIELIENTPEEILDVSIEMDERLKGTWFSTEEDEELQRRFWDIFPQSELHGIMRSRVGADFLKQNKELLY